MRRLTEWLKVPASPVHYDLLLMMCVLLLSGTGVYLIEGLEPGLGLRQGIGMILGLILLAVLSLLDYRRLGELGVWAYVIAMGTLLAVNIMGDISGGAARWLEIGSFRFQPSELAKLLLILFFAQWFARREEDVSRPGFFLATAALMALPLISILREPDLSTTIVAAWIFAWLWFSAGIDYRVLGRILAVILPLGGIFLFLVTREGQTILDDYQYRRIMAWLNPSEWAAESYQQMYSIMAIGSGGLLGNPGSGTDTATVIGSGFLPESHTDFIMAAAGQELGFLGCAAIILLEGIVTFRCLAIGMRCENMAGRIICAGMAAWIGGQTFVNLGVVSGLLPNTGLTLPFVSYGLTYMVSLYMGIGVVLNIGGQRRGKEREQMRRR